MSSPKLLDAQAIPQAPTPSGDGTTAHAYSLRPSQRFYRTLKALGDFFIALVALVVLSPLFLVVARLEKGGAQYGYAA